MTQEQLAADFCLYAVLVSAAVLIYDYFTLVGREVSWISEARHTHAVPRLALALFLLNRYLPFIDVFIMVYRVISHVSIDTCGVTTGIITTLTWLGIVLAECILMLRLWAISIDGAFMRPVIIMIGSMMTLGTITVTIELASFRYGATTEDGCYLVSRSNIDIFNWTLVLACETTLAALTFVKLEPAYRKTHTPLLSRMYHDGILFYCFLVAFTLLNISVEVFLPSEFTNVFATPQRVLHSVLCTRVMLVRHSQSADMLLPMARRPSAVSFLDEWPDPSTEEKV